MKLTIGQKILLGFGSAILFFAIAGIAAYRSTERLVDAREQVVNLRSELEHLRIEYTQYKVEQELMRSSAAFRLADRIWAVRNALGL